MTPPPPFSTGEYRQRSERTRTAGHAHSFEIMWPKVIPSLDMTGSSCALPVNDMQTVILYPENVQ